MRSRKTQMRALSIKSPTEGIPALLYRCGLRGQGTQRAMAAVA